MPRAFLGLLMVTSCHSDSSVRQTLFRVWVPTAASTSTTTTAATVPRSQTGLAVSRAVWRNRTSRKLQKTASASPTNGKNMRWSLVTSLSAIREVGSRARMNHRMPKAMGRVSRLREVRNAATSRAATNR